MKEKRKTGRPPTPPFTEMEKRLILALYSEGRIDEDVATVLGMNRVTFIQRCQKFPEFSTAIKQAKAEPNKLVENALFKRALGYDYTETTTYKSGEVKTTTKHVYPDPTSGIYWLNNRDPQRWRSVQHLEGSLKASSEHDFTPEELARIAAGDDPLKVLKDRQGEPKPK